MYYATVRYVHYFDYSTIIAKLHPITLLYTDDTKTKNGTRNKNNNNDDDKNEDEDNDHYTTLTTFRSLMRESQQPKSPIGFLLLKLQLPPQPCAELLVLFR